MIRGNGKTTRTRRKLETVSNVSNVPAQRTLATKCRRVIRYAGKRPRDVPRGLPCFHNRGCGPETGEPPPFSFPGLAQNACQHFPAQGKPIKDPVTQMQPMRPNKYANK
jgi:hypothetical protein